MDYEASIGLFREAIALDPALSIARAYLATILVQGVQFGWIGSTSELWSEVLSLAESSVRLDPRSSFAFSILSYVHAMEGNYVAARDAGNKAIELNPYDMGARGVLGISHLVVVSIGRPSSCFRRRYSAATAIPVSMGGP